MTRALVLIVADDAELASRLSAPFEEEYRVEVAESAAAATILLSGEQPLLIILLAELPDADGYDYCATLRDRESSQRAAILLVTPGVADEEEPRALEQGADAALALPLNDAELQSRSGALLRQASRLAGCAEASRQAQAMALQAMTESSQYGCVIRFFREAIACRTHDDLAVAFFEVMRQFGLHAALQLRGGQTMTLSGPGEPSPPLDVETFEALRGAGRLYHFGARTMVNDELVSFLVKNMPLDDEVACGRLKDVVAVLIEGLQAAALAIRRNDLIRLLLEDLKTILADLHQNFGHEDSRVMDALQRLQQTLPEIHSALHFLDLPAEQESYFEGLLDQSVMQTETLVSFLGHLQGRLEQLAVKLRLG